jgi:hypothetical protein
VALKAMADTNKINFPSSHVLGFRSILNNDSTLICIGFFMHRLYKRKDISDSILALIACEN